MIDDIVFIIFSVDWNFLLKLKHDVPAVLLLHDREHTHSQFRATIRNEQKLSCPEPVMVSNMIRRHSPRQAAGLRASIRSGGTVKLAFHHGAMWLRTTFGHEFRPGERGFEKFRLFRPECSRGPACNCFIEKKVRSPRKIWTNTLWRNFPLSARWDCRG